MTCLNTLKTISWSNYLNDDHNSVYTNSYDCRTSCTFWNCIPSKNNRCLICHAPFKILFNDKVNSENYVELIFEYFINKEFEY